MNNIYTIKYINDIIKNIESERNYLLSYNNIDYNNIAIKYFYNNKSFSEMIDYIIDNNLFVQTIFDYDCDGITSGLLLHYLLKELNIKHHNYPTKRKDGYGLKKETLDNLYKLNKFDVLITADLGVSNKEEIEYIKDKYNTICIITDHHTVNDLPNADIILNPKMYEYSNDNIYYYYMCGCGLVYKIFKDYFLYKNIHFNDNLYLPFVCIATIGDMVELEYYNYSLVLAGLDMINKRAVSNEKLQSILDTINETITTEESIAFQIVPLFNSVGRLFDQSLIMEYFLTDNISVSKLKAINNSRKELQKIEQEIAYNENLENKEKIIIFKCSSHKGLIGLISSYLTNKFKVPSIVLTDSGKDKNVLYGSCRSCNDINIYNVLNKSKKYLIGFGGHKFAAGLSLDKNNYEKFKTDIMITSLNFPCEYVHNIDCILNINNLDESIFNLIEKYRPFGQKNKKIIFCDKIKIHSWKEIGNHKFYKISHYDNNNWVQNCSFMELLSFNDTYGLNKNEIVIISYTIINKHSIILEDILPELNENFGE